MSNPYGFRSGRIWLALFLTVAFYSTLPSCKTRHKSITPVVKEPGKNEDKSAPDLQQLITDHAFKANNLNGKASVKSVTGNQTMSFTINFRMQTDSLIWISVSPLLGIEVARVLISKDSVKYIDRINNRYSITDYRLLNDLFDVNVDFEIIQGILTGNLFSYKKNKFNSVYLEDGLYILSTLSKRKLKRSLEDVDVSKPVVQDMWVDGSSYRITRLRIEDQRMNKSLDTQYSDHRLTEGGLFPFRSVTLVQTGQLVKIDIDFSKIIINSNPEFPFNIPDSYERVH